MAILQSNGILIVDAIPVHVPVDNQAILAWDSALNLIYYYNGGWQTQPLLSVSDLAYDSVTWDGITDIAPSQNAVRDAIEGLVAGVLPDGDYGSVTVSGGGTVITIDTAAVSLAMLADIATDRLLGRDTGGAGIPELLTVAGGVEFTGAGGIQTSAFTGDVTKAAGGTVTTIANDSVSLAKLANIATDSLIGRDTAGSGDPESITLDPTLEFTGSGTIQRAAISGDVVISAGSGSALIPNDTITYAKIQNVSATDRLLGRVTAGAGDVEEVVFTDFAQSILDDVDEATFKATVNLEIGTDVQAFDATLTALAGLNATPGVVVETAADTFTKRTLTGTANEITVTNGDGVAGAPTFSLPTTIDLGGKTSLEIPNSAAPTVNADGEIAVDTTVTDVSHGVLKFFGGEELAVIAVPIAELTGMVDGDVIKYNATNDEFTVAAEAAVVTPTLQQVLTAGSLLTIDNTITIDPTFDLLLTGDRDTDTLFEIDNTGTGSAVFAHSVDGAGVRGTSTNGEGVVGRSTNNAGVSAYSEGSQAITAVRNPASTNSVIPVVSITRYTSGSAANGIGAQLDFSVSTSINAEFTNKLISKWTDATSATRTSQFILTGVDSAVEADLFTVSGDGLVKLNSYGGGTFTGTATHSLNVDTDGNVIEGPVVPTFVYKAILAQTGTSIPTIVHAAINTLGEVPILSRNGVGDYELGIAGTTFTANKTYVTATIGHGSTGAILRASSTATNKIAFTTDDAADSPVDLEGNLSLLVEVYA